MIYSTSSHFGSLATAYNSSDGTSKIEVPIKSGLSVYAQFKYVRGIPAASGQESISLTKAKIIDNMVSYLNSSASENDLNKNEEYTVHELETEVHRTINDKKVYFNTLPGKGMDTGVIFNITA